MKVLLAQALFGSPDLLLLDEPTNNLDIAAINWLEDFLLDFPGTVIVVSHDRHFLNTICTHIVDIDYGKIKMYVGNYDFWYESCSAGAAAYAQPEQEATKKRSRNCRTSSRRFSANKSKSKQATARRKLLDKLTVEEMPCFFPPLSLCGFLSRPGGRKGHPVCHRREQNYRRREGARQGFLHRGARATKSPLWAKMKMARQHCSRFSPARWSRTRAL